MKMWRRFGTSALVTIAFLMLLGCASAVNLKPQLTPKPTSPELSRRIGIHHSSQFMRHQESADAYGNKHEFIFPIGQASERLFREIYPSTFQNFQYVNENADWNTSGKDFDAILEPEIDSFSFPLKTLKGPYWAEVVYRFNLYSLDGTLLFSWKLRGCGEAGDGTYGEFGSIAKSVELAIEHAAWQFGSSFRNIPELRRWTFGVPFDGVTASQAGQRVRVIQDGSRTRKEAYYDGVVGVAAELGSVETKKSTQDSGMKVPGVSGVRVFIKNEGHSPIQFDPMDFVFTGIDDKPIDPVPSSFIATELTPRFSPLSVGGGLGAIFEWVFFIAKESADAAKREELPARLKSVATKELQAMVLSEGVSVEGLVFLPVSPVGLAGELKTPVVHLDTNTRYLVTISLKGASSLGEQEVQ
jgi:hypothetical protein